MSYRCSVSPCYTSSPLTDTTLSMTGSRHSWFEGNLLGSSNPFACSHCANRPHQRSSLQAIVALPWSTASHPEPSFADPAVRTSSTPRVLESGLDVNYHFTKEYSITGTINDPRVFTAVPLQHLFRSVARGFHSTFGVSIRTWRNMSCVWTEGRIKRTSCDLIALM